MFGSANLKQFSKKTHLKERAWQCIKFRKYHVPTLSHRFHVARRCSQGSEESSNKAAVFSCCLLDLFANRALFCEDPFLG